MHRSWGLLLLIGMGVSPATAEEPAREDPSALKKLVDRLGSRRYADREAAMARLIAQRSPAALALLRKAAASRDPEVRRRAREVLLHLERCQETARVLRPQRVRLNFKAVTVAEAVADFARRTGIPVVLNDADRVRVAGRTVTLDTGETSAWDALRQLCARAGLSERPPAVVPTGSAFNPSREELGGRGQQVIFLDGRRTPVVKPDERLILVDGKAAAPTYLSGALRIQVLPPPPRPGKKGPDNVAREVSLTLNVDTEPRFQWNRVVALRIDRAVDALGQSLRQPEVYAGHDPSLSRSRSNEVIIVWDGRTELPREKTRQVPLRLRLGEKPAARIKELCGTLTVELETPTEPLVTVRDILTAAGKSVKGTDNASVKVVEVKRSPSGQVTLQVEVKGLPRASNFAGMANVRVLRINRRRGMRTVRESLSAREVENCGLTLLDDKEQPIAFASGSRQINENPFAVQAYTLHFEPRKDQGTPDRFVYSGRRTVVLDVPFTLKDVPLP